MMILMDDDWSESTDHWYSEIIMKWFYIIDMLLEEKGSSDQWWYLTDMKWLKWYW